MESSWTFGPFVFDHATGILSRDGKTVAVGTRAGALLAVLVKAEGSPVSKEILIEAGWPGLTVEEGNLSVQIANLRKAMGPRPDGQDWIATVPRVGYRLLKATFGAGEASATAVFPTLAVLPFENMSDSSEEGYFADGITEDITTALSRFRQFAVVARNSAFGYRGHATDVRRIGRELGVRYALKGSVRRAGSRLRITAQLADAESGAELWSDRFDGTAADVFDMQDRLTESVVAIVEPRVKRAEIERARRKRPENLDAYDLYLQALPAVYMTRPEANARAIELLDRAMALDPSFAPAVALAGMARMCGVAMQFPCVSDEDREIGCRHARAALALGSEDATVLGWAGYVLLALGREWDTGVALLKRAVAANPNNVAVLAEAGTGFLLGGDLDEAAECYERALRLNPSEFATHWEMTGMAHVRMAQRRYEEALDWAMRSQGVNASFDANHWMLIAANAYLDRMPEARRWLSALQVLTPGVTLARIRRGQNSVDPWRIDVLLEGMRLAGMPDA